MHRFALGLAAALALASAGTAIAQQAPELEELEAERSSDTQIDIEFEYEGSACEEVGTAQLGAITNGVLALTFPTTRTAETCTMQMDEHEVEQTIEVNESVTEVQVTLLRPDGTVAAIGSDEVEDD